MAGTAEVGRAVAWTRPGFTGWQPCQVAKAPELFPLTVTTLRSGVSPDRKQGGLRELPTGGSPLSVGTGGTCLSSGLEQEHAALWEAGVPGGGGERRDTEWPWAAASGITLTGTGIFREDMDAMPRSGKAAQEDQFTETDVQNPFKSAKSSQGSGVIA